MKIYTKYFMMHLRSAMQYKSSFVMLTLGQFLTSFSAFLAVWFLFKRFEGIGDYSFGEVMICYAVSLISFSLTECFFRGFDTFASVLGNGSFDRIMVRPQHLILQVLCQKIELSRIGRLIQSLIIFAAALTSVNIDWNLAKAGTLVVMIIGCSAIFAGLFIIYAAFCFFTTEGLEFMNIFTDGGRELSYYPIGIYGKEILTFYTFVIPLACAQYYPFLYITGRSNSILYPFMPLTAFIFLIPCYLFWKLGVRHYKSTGS